MWYHNKVPEFETKTSKSLIHPFIVKGHKGLTINPYQGCQHRCGYCYATYDWSPEFYDKIYAKNNAAEVLENQLKSSKTEVTQPVMVSSATDAYQPAEIKFGLTRKCVKVLQKYGIPYYIFTKSTIISRDLELHKKYKDNCFIIWSITTCNERIRRLIEPGTPPASSIFRLIEKFIDNGICCGVNIDPILPLITDCHEELETILDSCNRSGVRHVVGALLRLRADIWKRMKIILRLLNIDDGINEYIKKIYQFTEPLSPGSNIAASEPYSSKVLHALEQKVLKNGISFDFPQLVGKGNTTKAYKSEGHTDQQFTLTRYM
jgi:DNA repair photolyase